MANDREAEVAAALAEVQQLWHELQGLSPLAHDARLVLEQQIRAVSDRLNQAEADLDRVRRRHRGPDRRGRG